MEKAVEDLADLITGQHLKASSSVITKTARSLAEACESYITRFFPVAEECVLHSQEKRERQEGVVQSDEDSVAQIYDLLMVSQSQRNRHWMDRMVTQLEDYRDMHA